MEVHYDKTGEEIAGSGSLNLQFNPGHHSVVEGFIASDEALTAKLQVGAGWHTVESETVSSGTPLGYVLRIPGGGQVRLRLENAGGSTATVSYRVVTREG